MQIHELNPFTGQLTDDDVLVIDDGAETTKIQWSKIKSAVENIAEAAAEKREIFVLNIPSFNSLPKTVANENITDDMIVVNSELGTPSTQTADWTVTTSNGSLQITGTNAISGSTTAKLYLARSR